MSFYSSISPYYNEIFPIDAAEMAFVEHRLPEGASILDLGCGTGNKTVHCAGRGREILGVDEDPDMIAAARASATVPGLRYEVLPMLEADRALGARRFDAVLCLGNTLVHLTDPARIGEMLGKMAGLLNDDGFTIIQILNYDRILSRGLWELPVLETKNIRFERSYAPRDALLRFQTRLTVKGTGEELRNDIPLYPLRREELADMLLRAGFGRAEWFGSYRGGALTEDSFPLIVQAWKQ